MLFNHIILLLLIIFILIGISLWRKPGIGEAHTLNGSSMRKWIRDNGYQLDFLNQTLVRKKDGKKINIKNMGNEVSVRKKCGVKNVTSQLMIDNGIPAPPFYVCDPNLSVEDNMANIYLKLNPPFVVKPTIGTKGQGITVDIKTYDELYEKVKSGMRNSVWVLDKHRYNKCQVEEYTQGKDYRIFMHNHKVVDVVEKVRGAVKGDGNSTLQELINIYNEDPKKRQKGASKGHTLTNIDEKYFKKQGYSLDSIVPSGKTVELSGVINLSNGAISKSVDINDVHPDNIQIFEKCSKVLNGVNLGIDYVSPSISLPYTSGGVIIEVNSQPGFGPHRVAHKSSPKIYKKFVEALFE